MNKMYKVMIQFINYTGNVDSESLMASCPSKSVANQIRDFLANGNDSTLVRYIVKE